MSGRVVPFPQRARPVADGEFMARLRAASELIRSGAGAPVGAVR